MSTLNGCVQRRSANLIDGIGLGAGAQERLHGLRVAGENGAVKCAAGRFAGISTAYGRTLQESVDQLQIANTGGIL